MSKSKFEGLRNQLKVWILQHDASSFGLESWEAYEGRLDDLLLHFCLGDKPFPEIIGDWAVALYHERDLRQDGISTEIGCDMVKEEVALDLLDEINLEDDPSPEDICCMQNCVHQARVAYLRLLPIMTRFLVDIDP